MRHLDDTLARLAHTRECAYHADGTAAAEPTALVSLALLAHGRHQEAAPHVVRLLEVQTDEGCIGIEPSQQSPPWATALAVLAWRAAQTSPIFDIAFDRAVHRALGWLLATEGTVVEHGTTYGHDTRLRGWPWVAGTHSWIEPTAFSVLALKHARLAAHHRAADGVRLLVDRMFDTGGCNYGNTVVFGQPLRPQVQPTGIALLALAAEGDASGRIARSVDYLQRALSARTATASLCFGLLGLAAQQAFPDDAADWLDVACERTVARGASSYKLALLALAALGERCPMIARVRALDPAAAR